MAHSLAVARAYIRVRPDGRTRLAPRSQRAESAGACPRSDPSRPPHGSELLPDVGACDEILLAEGENLLGRGLDATARIESATVSRRHARDRPRRGRATIEDLGSKNGTYLNGRRLSGPATARRRRRGLPGLRAPGVPRLVSATDETQTSAEAGEATPDRPRRPRAIRKTQDSLRTSPALVAIFPRKSTQDDRVASRRGRSDTGVARVCAHRVRRAVCRRPRSPGIGGEHDRTEAAVVGVPDRAVAPAGRGRRLGSRAPPRPDRAARGAVADLGDLLGQGLPGPAPALAVADTGGAAAPRAT